MPDKTSTELLDTKEVDGVWYVLVLIEEPGDPIYERDALGIRYVSGHEERREEWVPLASFIIQHKLLGLSDEKMVAAISLEEALLAEGWTPPASNQETGPS